MCQLLDLKGRVTAAALHCTSGREATLASQSVAHLASKPKRKERTIASHKRAKTALRKINMRRPTSMRVRATATARLPQSLPTLLSLAYFTASSTTAFLVTPRAARPAPISSSLHREQFTACCRTSASRQQRHSLSSTRQISTARPSWSSDRARTAASTQGGGVSALRSVAAPAGLEQVSGLSELLYPRNGVSERFVFFGGKGGVGKTSTAAAVAIQCADAGLR